MSSESHLISMGWERRESESDPKYCWFQKNQKSKYGKSLAQALEIQAETDTLNEYGIAWKIIKDSFGYGHRVMFAFKGECYYRLFGIYQDEKKANEILAECEDLYENAESFARWKTEPYFWVDHSNNPRYIFKKGHYGDSIYLVRTYTELVKVCWEFFKKYVKTHANWSKEVPKKPSCSIDDVPIEVKDVFKRVWESYESHKKAHDEFDKVRNRFKVIEKHWEKEWPEFAKEVIDWTMQLYYSPDFRIEDFNEIENISES